MEGFDPTHTTGSPNQGGDYDLLKALATVQALKKVKREAEGGGEAGEAKARWIDRMVNVWGGEFEKDMQIGASERCCRIAHSFILYALPVRLVVILLCRPPVALLLVGPCRFDRRAPLRFECLFFGA